jgi:hypothetical protein
MQNVVSLLIVTFAFLIDLASGEGFEPSFSDSKSGVLPVRRPRKKLVDHARFERATSTFARLRSDSVELMVRK